MIKGIDISHWQGVIDWTKVKTDFAIMKTTQGVSMVDDKFLKNKEQARANGILVGYYHFANGGDPVKEAEFFLKVVGDIKEGELLALDWEIPHANPVTWCKTFLDTCTKKAGFKPLFYTNSARLKQYDWSPVVSGNYGLWVAQYGLNTCIPIGSPYVGQWPFYAIWQYCSRGSVPGIRGNVDMNSSKMTLETLKKYGKQGVECTHCCPKHCS